MGLMTRILGGDLFAPTQATGGAPLAKVFQMDGGFSPANPGDMKGYRSAPVLKAPRSFNKLEADRLEQLAAQKAAEATATRRATNALARVERADAAVVRAYYGTYAPTVASAEYQKIAAKASYARHLQSQRPAYAALGAGLDRETQRASARVRAIAAGLL